MGVIFAIFQRVGNHLKAIHLLKNAISHSIFKNSDNHRVKY